MRAINQKSGKIYAYGPLSTTPRCLGCRRSAAFGILQNDVLDPSCLVVIRAHGIPPQEKEQLKALGCQIIDATCPRVAKVQAIIRKWAKQDYATIIVGDEDHPEVLGLMGYTEGRGHVVVTSEDVAQLPALYRVLVVAQTTQMRMFLTTEWLRSKLAFPKCGFTILL